MSARHIGSALRCRYPIGLSSRLSGVASEAPEKGAPGSIQGGEEEKAAVAAALEAEAGCGALRGSCHDLGGARASSGGQIVPWVDRVIAIDRDIISSLAVNLCLHSNRIPLEKYAV